MYKLHLFLFLLLISLNIPVRSQALLLPSPSQFANGTGECEKVFVAIANEDWRVRKGASFEVSAAHPFSPSDGFSYQWQVSNGKIVSGLGTQRIKIKAGGGTRAGYLNASGFVSILLRVTKTFAGGSCNVETSREVMIGRHAESNSFANVDDVALDETRLVRQCPPGKRPIKGQIESPDMLVGVSVKASDLENDVLTFAYFASAGKIVGKGERVQWDLTEADSGTHTLIVAADDGNGLLGRTVTRQVTIQECDGDLFVDCPSITIVGPDTVGSDPEFTANVVGGFQDSVTYEWTAVGGEIIEGQGTPSVKVKIHTRPGGSITVKIGGLEKGGCNSSKTADWR